MSATKLSPFYRYVLLATYILVAVINFWPLDEYRFEDDPEVLISPADWAFSIWGVIFIGMIGFSVVLAKAAEPATPSLRRAIIGLFIAGLASIAFVPLSIQGNQLLILFNVILHLIALTYAYGGLRQHVATTPARPRSRGFWYFGPSMYLAWIAAATVLAFALTFEALGFEPGVQAGIIMTLVLIVVLMGIARQFLAKADAIVALTVAWALFAIGVKQWAFLSIRYAAWAAAAILIVTTLLRVSRGKIGFYTTPGYYADGDRATPSRVSTSSVPS